MSQNADITEALQSLEVDPIVSLYEIDASNQDAGIYHFCSMSKENQIVVFGGISYVPIALETEGWEKSSQGSLPTPTVRISNVTKALSSLVIAYNDLLGANFTRIRTLRKFLDGESGQNPNAYLIKDVYQIEKKNELSKNMIEWQLSASIDQQGKMLPGRQYLKDACTHIYRYYKDGAFDYSRASCPYSGDNYFTQTGNVTTSPVQDKCGKKLSDCRLRFGEKGKQPFRGFPGTGGFNQ